MEVPDPFSRSRLQPASPLDALRASLDQVEIDRFLLRLTSAPEPLKSLRTTCPPFMTNFTRSSSVTSFAGLPETPTKSAYLPLSIDPTRSPQPIFSAPTEVAERMACRGVIPYSTIVW